MSFEQLGVILERIEEYVVKKQPRRASILWHGGEPLVMGTKFYREVLERCAEIEKRTGYKLEHIMQSNLTLVTDEMADVLKELLTNGRIGSSYDPIAGYRLLKGKRSYEEEWKKGLQVLKRKGVGVGIVYVAHKGSLGNAAQIYHGLKDLDFGGGLRVNPLYSAGLARDSKELHISPQDWGRFLLDLYEVWKKDQRSMRVDPFRSWQDMAAGRSARITCAFSGRCTYNFTGIKVDGTVYSCGRSLDEGLNSFGNIYRDSLVDILDRDARKIFLHRQEWLVHGECAGCRWWTFCHGGCPNDAFLGHGDMMRKTYWCEGRKLFLDTVFGHLKSAAAAPEPEDAGGLFDDPGGGQP